MVPEPAADVIAALSKSGMLWIQLPDRTWPAWHVYVEQTCYVVTGPGEQPLPDLPDEVHLIVRAKDTRDRVASIPARARRVPPDADDWQVATSALAKARLNAPGVDLAQRWASEGTVWALLPDLEAADTAPPTRSGAAPPVTSPATTDTWRPTHLPARPTRRKRPHWLR